MSARHGFPRGAGADQLAHQETQIVEPLPDEEAKTKKQAALIKGIGASVLSDEDQVDALRERLAWGMRP
jgi:hypothetical protein